MEIVYCISLWQLSTTMCDVVCTVNNSQQILRACVCVYVCVSVRTDKTQQQQQHRADSVVYCNRSSIQAADILMPSLQLARTRWSCVLHVKVAEQLQSTAATTQCTSADRFTLGHS